MDQKEVQKYLKTWRAAGGKQVIAKDAPEEKETGETDTDVSAFVNKWRSQKTINKEQSKQNTNGRKK
jgi:hypothetical protein